MRARNRTQQTGQAGQHYVAAEICRRGAWAATLAGNVSEVDIYAGSADHKTLVSVQVKTRTTGTWHASFPKDARQGTEADADNTFWVFVDLETKHPVFYIVPGWWIRNNIWEVHTAYLSGPYRERHEDEPRKSPHHGITAGQIAQWKDCWDLLRIFDEAGQDSERA